MDETANRLLDKLRRVVDSERDRGISYASCIGCIEIVKDEIMDEQRMIWEENE